MQTCHFDAALGRSEMGRNILTPTRRLSEMQTCHSTSGTYRSTMRRFTFVLARCNLTMTARCVEQP
jgi:hypothetical protein